MRFPFNRTNLAKPGFAIFFIAFALFSARALPAQEQYSTVARVSFVSGPVSYSRGDDPDDWDDAIENLPLSVGDRLYAPDDGRAELQLSSGNFIRLAARSYLSALNLRDEIKQFYLGEGTAALNVRRLGANEVIEIDTPNVSVTFDQPGIYRIVVDENGDSRISVRRGRAVVAASGRQLTVENSEIRIYGIDSPNYDIVALPGPDAFDRWVGERDDRFNRAYPEASRYASEDIIGVEDLANDGRWEQIPEYGYAWTPTAVAVGWVPFSAGRWFWQDPWGWTWISNDRWSWATSHYGRWMPYRSRWYWVPVRPRTRGVRYAPAVVEFVRVRDHIGWFPLHPRDRFIPWWERRDRRPVTQNITYVNRTYVTVVNQNNFISARPVNNYLVRDTTIVRQVSSARMTESLPIPNRTSLRIVSETGVRHGQRPSATVLARPAVVRTVPSPPPLTFQQKFLEIEKNQGRPIAPSTATALRSQTNHSGTSSTRFRPAAVVEPNAKAFAPRNLGANSGPAPQAVAPAHGQKLATRENPIELKTKTPERPERVQKPPAQPPQPASSAPAPSTGAVKRLELPPERTRQQLEIQKSGRDRQALEQQQKLQRRQHEQQKSQEHQAQIHQQQQQRLQNLRQQQQVEQQAHELQRQQEQLSAQQLRQKQLQEHQARESQKQEHAQPPQQKAVEHKAPVAPPQQDLRRLPPQRQQQPEGPQGQGIPGQPGPRFSPRQ
ncbi:MAG: hypothetical protein QOF64_1105 [Candidatus Binatota bacterium]|nr:hypothetical protein [Candidatus Binatota bacterium]